MNTKPVVEMYKRNQPCNYLSGDWLYQGSEDGGIRLKSTCKNVSDLIVPFHRKNNIKSGFYQSRR